MHRLWGEGRNYTRAYTSVLCRLIIAFFVYSLYTKYQADSTYNNRRSACSQWTCRARRRLPVSFGRHKRSDLFLVRIWSEDRGAENASDEALGGEEVISKLKWHGRVQRTVDGEA